MDNLTLDSEIKKLKDEISTIKERNKRVEANKAWEISLTRRISIAIGTYLVVALFMYSIGVADPLINAGVPVIGYLLSTVSLGIIKNYWISQYRGV